MRTGSQAHSKLRVVASSQSKIALASFQKVATSYKPQLPESLKLYVGLIVSMPQEQ